MATATDYLKTIVQLSGAQSYTAQLAHMGTAAKDVGVKMAIALGAVGAAWGVAAKTAAEFDKQMRNVNSIAKVGEGNYRALKDEVLSLALDKNITDGPTKLAQGLYQIESSGFQGAMAMKILEVSAKGGAAGMSDTFTAASALTGIMNAYNQKTGPDAERIMDVLFKTVEVGVVTFEQLAGAIGPAAAIAAQAGVPLEELGAATSVMTKRGIDANMTLVSLTRIMTAFLDPPKELAEGLKQYTDETGASILRTKGLSGAIDYLGRIAGDKPEVLAQLGLEARALRAAMALSGQGAEEMAGDLRKMYDAAGSATAALEEQHRSQAHGWELLKKSLEIFGIAAGDLIAGPLEELAESLAGLTDILSTKLPAAKPKMDEFWAGLKQGWTEISEILGIRTPADAVDRLVKSIEGIQDATWHGRMAMADLAGIMKTAQIGAYATAEGFWYLSEALNKAVDLQQLVSNPIAYAIEKRAGGGLTAAGRAAITAKTERNEIHKQAILAAEDLKKVQALVDKLYAEEGQQTGAAKGAAPAAEAEAAAIDKVKASSEAAAQTLAKMNEQLKEQKKELKELLGTTDAYVGAWEAYVGLLEARGVKGAALKQARAGLAAAQFGQARQLYSWAGNAALSRQESWQMYGQAMSREAAGWQTRRGKGGTGGVQVNLSVPSVLGLVNGTRMIRTGDNVRQTGWN